MLQFIFGKSLSGKTSYVFKKIKEITDKGIEAVLIVPEQFTFESEKKLLKEIGECGLLNVNVLSFSRLYDEIGRKIDGIAGTVLRDSDKIIFMHRAMNSVADDLILWGKYRSSVAFAKTVLDTVGEFKINSVKPDDLRNIAETLTNATLKSKLFDLALIYDAYNMTLGEKFIDPADILTRVYEALSQYKYFKHKVVFFDSFKGFTGQQYRIIDRIFSQAEDVYISLTNDPEIKGEYSIFRNIRKTVSDIEKIALKNAVPQLPPTVLKSDYRTSSELSCVERILAGDGTDFDSNAGKLTVCKAQTVYDEALFAAHTIRRLVRTENYRYSDFVIIARDAEKYQSAVASACKMNNVNCFFDSKVSLSAFPFSVAVENIFNALNFNTEALLNFHKTGLGGLENDEIAALENYAFIWSINGKMWLSEWDMDPRGLTADEDKDGKYREQLERLNILRLKAIKPIERFKADLKTDAYSISKAIVNLFEACRVQDKLNEMCRQFSGINNAFYADSIKSAYDEFMAVLDSLVRCYGKASISYADFAKSLNLAVSLTQVGIIPQTMDEVVFGEADRIRISAPKIAFILGANQGEFPKTVVNKGIFALNERKLLIEGGIAVSDNGIYASIDESFLVYSNVSCSTDRLYISYSTASLTGEVLEPSSFIESLNKKINPVNVSFPDGSSPETEASAFSEYCRLINKMPQNANAIKDALSDSEYAEKISALCGGDVKRQDKLSPILSKELYGNNINMSATRFDTFNRCHFSYFCKYGLRAEKQEAADFNVLQRGTIVHYVLERVISEFKKGIADLEYPVLDELCDRYISEYLNSVKGFNSVKNAKTDFIIGRISRSLKEVLHNISDEMKQSEFEPIACELKIGKGGTVPAVKFPFDGGNIYLNGSIDRVDEFDGYIRIIDYKTGSKTFKLPDILVGLNMQMLLYLYAVIRGGVYPNSKSAGILYKPAKRDINESSTAMNGLIPADERIITAMEREGNGEFVPKLTIKKDGTVSKANESFIDYEDFDVIFDYIEQIMKSVGNKLSSGDIEVSPIDGRESNACKYCDYAAVCGIEDSATEKVEKLRNSQVIDKIKESIYGD